MQAVSQELLELLDRTHFSYAALKEIERRCVEFFNRYPPNSLEHSTFSTLALAVLRIAEKLKASDQDPLAVGMLNSEIRPLLRQAIKSHSMADIHALIEATKWSAGESSPAPVT
jgi:hypothetical protein